MLGESLGYDLSALSPIRWQAYVRRPPIAPTAPRSGTPEQDWDIIATPLDFGFLFLTLAADRQCPHRRFFLGCLYLLVGDTVRTRFQTMPEVDLSALTDEAMSIGEAWVSAWGHAPKPWFVPQNPSTTRTGATRAGWPAHRRDQPGSDITSSTSVAAA